MTVLLDLRKASEYSGLSERYLRRLIFEKRITYYKDRRRVFLMREDLEAYIEALRRDPQGLQIIEERRSARGTKG